MDLTVAKTKVKAFSTKNTLTLHGRLLDLSTPRVMGILNVTPDSFYAQSRQQSISALVKQAGQMLEQGATFLDVGGYSSRPGATNIALQEELDRVLPAIQAIVQHFPEALISVDTFRAPVAHQAVQAGASMINDISGGHLDANMYATVAKAKVPYVLMHMKGTPQNMKSLAQYQHLLTEMVTYFQKAIYTLQQMGVADIVVDPGFGFAKTIAHNYEILQNLRYFEVLNQPLLAGLSRKSMIYKTLGIEPQEALNGTSVLNAFALMQGAAILRVHDVAPAVQAIKLFKRTFL